MTLFDQNINKIPTREEIVELENVLQKVQLELDNERMSCLEAKKEVEKWRAVADAYFKALKMITNDTVTIFNKESLLMEHT